MKQQNLFKQSLNPVRNTYNCFVVFIQTLNVDLDYPVRVIGKNLTLPKHEDIILNPLTQVREKWVSLFCVELTFERYGSAMVFGVFISIFLGSTSVTVMVIFSKAPFCKLELCLKFLLNNYEAQWQRHLTDTWQLNILRKWINVRANFFLVKHRKTKTDKIGCKISSFAKIQACKLENITPK